MDAGFAPFMEDDRPQPRAIPTIDPPDAVMDTKVDPDILGHCPMCANKFGVTIDSDDLLIAAGCVLVAVLLYKRG